MCSSFVIGSEDFTNEPEPSVDNPVTSSVTIATMITTATNKEAILLIAILEKQTDQLDQLEEV